jgi:hypothetical protein
MALESARIESERVYAEKLEFTIAQLALVDQERRINDVRARLEDFAGFEKKEDDKSLPACEPKWMYWLDESNIP